MKILKEKHSFIVNLFLFLIANTIIFRGLCTLIIICFFVYCLFSVRDMTFPKKATYYILIIATPLLLEIAFFWNNDDFRLGIKSLEKSISLLLFPIFIIGNYKCIKFYKLLKAYSITTTILIFIFLVRYYFVFNQYFMSFYYGMNMWQMGYHFSNTIGIHAPALNMHLAFVSICNLYFLLLNFREGKSFLIQLLYLFIFLFSFFFLLIINTRIALIVSILGYLIIVISYFLKSQNVFQITKKIFVVFTLILSIFIVFIKNNSFMKEKYNRMIFDKFEMVGKLDQIERPEVEIYSSLVTRLTIWKETIDLAKNHLIFGVGSSDSKKELFKYYEKTNQKFLTKYQLPVHNQYLDFLLKFGVLGLIGVLLYIGYIAYVGVKLKNVIVISFFILFSICNFTDDFLIRFDGIVFSGFWISLFTSLYLQTTTIKPILKFTHLF